MPDIISGNFLKHRNTIDHFMWRVLQILGQQGTVFLIFIFSSKLLSSYDFGIYNYALASVFFLILLGDFGISTATSKYVAEYNLKSPEKLRAILFNSGLVILLLSLAVSLAGLLFGRWYLQENYIYFMILLPLAFLVPMVSLYDGVYRGLRKFKSLALISVSVSVIVMPISYMIIERYGLIGALFSQSIFYSLLLLSLAGGYREFYFGINRSVIKEIGAYSFIYGLASVGNYLFARFSILILGHYHYISQIGSYELLNKIFMIFLIPFTLLGQVVAPNFAELSAEKNYKKIYQKSINYTFIFLVAGLILGAILYFLLPEFFKLFFQDFYSKDYFGEMFILCLIVYVANVCAATFDAGILVPTGNADIMAKFYLGLGLLGGGLALISVNYWGFLGVLIASATSSVLMLIGLRFFYFVRIKRCIREES